MNLPVDKRLWGLAPFLVWPLAVAIALAFRVPLAIDETRYLSVAWEMYSGADWLVPHLNGLPYTHKPPLLFWLITLGWQVFGVNDWWPRLVPLLAGLAGMLVVRRLAQQLWPETEDLPAFAVILAGGMLAWTLLTGLIMFDLLLALWVLVGLSGLARAGAGDSRGWAIYGLGLGLGLLTKGPVALLHLLPAAALAPWWSRAARRNLSTWYARLAVWFVFGAAMVLAWVVPAALEGGEAYSRTLLWTQTANRIAGSFAHQRPWWWYLPLLPVMMLPWLAWRPALQGLRSAVQSGESGARFCIAWAAPPFVAFCFISGKQPQYLLPLLPAFALLAGRGLATSYAMSYRPARVLAVLPWLLVGLVMAAGTLLGGAWHRGWFEDVHVAWPIALLAVAVWAAAPARASLLEGAARVHVAAVLSLALLPAALLGSATGRPYAVGPTAHEVASLQDRGITVAYYGDYHGQLGFAGRLRRPLPELWDVAAIADLARRDPTALVLLESRDNPLGAGPQLPSSVTAYRTGFWSIWKATQLAAAPTILAEIRARGPQPGADRVE
jgi:4-amino-4-deoxy-L-arabinose transferase-like glycosyltransferase